MGQIGPFLIGLGTIAFAVAYTFKNYRQGGDAAENKLISANRDLINTLQATVSVEKDARLKCQEQINALSAQMGELTGRVNTYKEILENRSPDLEKTLQELKVVAEAAVIFMKDMRESKLVPSVTVVK